MVFCGSRLKATGQISYHLETKTCFSLFDNLDLFSSGCFSRKGAGLFKGEASIIFKTPSTADVLILELVTVYCFCVSGLIHFRHRVMQFTANQVAWYKCPPLSFLLLGTSCLGRIWLAVLDFQNGEQQSRSIGKHLFPYLKPPLDTL